MTFTLVFLAVCAANLCTGIIGFAVGFKFPQVVDRIVYGKPKPKVRRPRKVKPKPDQLDAFQQQGRAPE